jgi:hypothetical protein
VDRRTDVYALGIVIYEMLTGRVPFVGDGYGEILVQHLTQRPVPPSQFRMLPAHVEVVVLKALEKRADMRYPTMEEFMRAMSDPVGFVEAHGGVGGFLQRQLMPSNAPLPSVRLTPAPLTPLPGTLIAPSGRGVMPSGHGMMPSGHGVAPTAPGMPSVHGAPSMHGNPATMPGGRHMPSLPGVMPGGPHIATPSPTTLGSAAGQMQGSRGKAGYVLAGLVIAAAAIAAIIAVAGKDNKVQAGSGSGSGELGSGEQGSAAGVGPGSELGGAVSGNGTAGSGAAGTGGAAGTNAAGSGTTGSTGTNAAGSGTTGSAAGTGGSTGANVAGAGSAAGTGSDAGTGGTTNSGAGGTGGTTGSTGTGGTTGSTGTGGTTGSTGTGGTTGSTGTGGATPTIPDEPTAELGFSSEPRGARIYIENVDTGKITPAKLSIPKKSRTSVSITLRLKGYEPYSFRADLTDGAQQNADLVKIKSTPPPPAKCRTADRAGCTRDSKGCCVEAPSNGSGSRNGSGAKTGSATQPADRDDLMRP